MATEWKDVFAVTELNPGDVREFSHDGMDLLIFRTRSGALRAMEAHCPHMRNYIPNGLAPDQDLACLLHDEELVCPFHLWRFDGLGYCTGIPDGQRVPTRVTKGIQITKSWPLREIGGVIQIGAASAAIAKNSEIDP